MDENQRQRLVSRPIVSSLRFRLLIQLALGFSPGIIAQAQTTAIVGVVRDSANVGIEAVEMLAGNGVLTRTDARGAFAIRQLASRPVSLQFRRLGFEPLTIRLDTLPASSRDSLDVRLQRSPSALPAIVVAGQAYDKVLWDRGFYARRVKQDGVFFDPDFLAHYGGGTLGSLVREAPRVDVRMIGTTEYAFGTIAGAPCRMNIFVDGYFKREAMPSPNDKEGLGLSELLGFRDVYAVEVYPRFSSVPIAFSRMGPGSGVQGKPVTRIPSAGNIMSSGPKQGENSDAACGAIVIWTKPVDQAAP